MKIFEAVRTCPMCGMESMLTLFGKECDQYDKHSLYGMAIQTAMPETGTAEREFLRLTHNPNYEGYCHDHMQMLFSKTSDRIKPYISVCDELEIDEDDNDLDEKTYNQYYNDLSSFNDQYVNAGLTCGGRPVIFKDYKGDPKDILFKGVLLALIKCGGKS